jgi:putative hemolysin
MHVTVARTLARAGSFTRLGRAYVRASKEGAPDFATRALMALDITPVVDDLHVSRIPADGPLLVVANHPSGAVDGLLLLSILARRRHDVKLVANGWLGLVPELRPLLLPIDLFGGRGAARGNGSSLRAARRWLQQGGCVVLFPAGEVAHAADARGAVADSPWQPSAAWLAATTRARVLPVFIGGANSRLFRIAGRLHPLLRTALLPRELWSKRGAAIEIDPREPIEPAQLEALPDDAARTAMLRAAVEASPSAVPDASSPPRTPIAERGRAADLEANIAGLGEALIESGSYQVFCAAAHALPAVLPEIGRLREVAFRQAGEGTGLARDLDRFDETYQHLFVWDRGRREIAGGYRLGATDVAAAGGRVDGLYTRTLFDYDARLLEQIGPAIELGRSFVAPPYQRDFSPLLLLWKGISRVVAQSRRYRRLFGVVSVSDRYQTTTRQLLVTFLQTRRFDADIGRLVRAKNPPPAAGGGTHLATVNSLNEVSSLIRRIEPDGKDMPVLLRQYLKMNAKFLGFTVDAAFGNVLDGLVLVDLDEVEPALLARYMGREAASAFVAQGVKPSAWLGAP